MFYKLVSYFNFRGKHRITNIVRKFLPDSEHVVHPNNYPADVKFSLSPAWETESEFLLFGCPANLMQELNFIKNNYKGGIIIDVGANMGLYSLFFSDGLGAKVIAFEPMPEIFEKLKRNISLNECSVIAEQMALDEKDGLSDLWIPENFKKDSGRSTIIREKSYFFEYTRSLSVKTTTLDNYCEKNNLGKIGLVKIDAEGAEIPILRGAGKTMEKWGPAIYFEAVENVYGNYENAINEFSRVLPGYTLYFQYNEEKIPIREAIRSGKIRDGNWFAEKL
jgi:FkbM family methyltransferase